MTKLSKGQRLKWQSLKDAKSNKINVKNISFKRVSNRELKEASKNVTSFLVP